MMIRHRAPEYEPISEYTSSISTPSLSAMTILRKAPYSVIRKPLYTLFSSNVLYPDSSVSNRELFSIGPAVNIGKNEVNIRKFSKFLSASCPLYTSTVYPISLSE